GTSPEGARAGPPRALPSQLQLDQVVAQVGIAKRLPDLRQVCLLAPEFELLAHAHQHGLLLDADGMAVAGGDADAAVAVGLDERGRADQLELQLAVDRAGARERVDLVAHALPHRLRVDVEAAGLERV